MNGKSFHMGLDVRGAIRNGAWKRELVGACTDSETGRKLTSNEILDTLLDHVAEGHRVIPFAGCDNWDWQTGCRGHESALEEWEKSQ